MSGIPETVAALIKSAFLDGGSVWPEGEQGFEAQVFDTALAHGLLPVLNYLDDMAGCCQGWPETIRSEMRHAARTEVAIEMARQDEIRRVLTEMKNAGVRPLLLKGTQVSCQYYPAFGLRPRCDTDLLIRGSDRLGVAALMTRLGYPVRFGNAGEYLSTQTCYPSQGRMLGIHSWDVHWSISNSGRFLGHELCYEKLITNAVGIPELGSNARTLSHVDALLLACFHRAAHFSHSGDRLIWLYDIHLMAGALSEESFNAFLEKASRLRIMGLCRDALSTSREWFGTSLSDPKLARMQTPEGSEASALYLKPGRVAGIKQHALLEINALGSWRERGRLLFQNVFPPVEYMRWRYKIKTSLILPFYYAYRFVFGVYVFAKG